jgi:hypothetical protein
MEISIDVGRWPDLISRQAALIRELGEAVLHAKDGLIQWAEFWAITDLLMMRIEEVQREMKMERVTIARTVADGTCR